MSNTKPKKLTVVIPTMNMGGCEKNLSLLLPELSHKFDCTLICHEHKQSYSIPKNIKYVCLNIVRKNYFLNNIIRNICLIKQLRNCIKLSDPSVILSFLDLNNVLVFVATRFLSVPLICAEHTINHNFFFKNKNLIGKAWLLKSLLHFTYNKVDALIVISQTMAKYLKTDLNIITKTKIIYNGFDLPDIADVKRPLEYKGIKGKILVSVGRLDDNKNQIYQLKLMQILNKQISDIHLFILGDGENFALLSKKIVELNLVDNVHLLGWQVNIYPYIKYADALVHTSFFESFGNVIVEALAFETPVVCSFVDDVQMEITNSKLLCLIKNINTDNMVSEIKLALSIKENQNNIVELKKVANEVRQKFSSKVMIKSYCSVVNSDQI